jgi:thiol:disulfide interchange protein DsbD
MFRKISLLLSLLTAFLIAEAQNAPCNWSFSAKEMGPDSYEIHCTAVVQVPWHIYSQFTPAGGPVPTKFVFTKNPLYKIGGAAKEEGKMITRHEEVFGVDVKYFEGDVDFVQMVKMKHGAKTNFTGSVSFMVCNDTECLPPKSLKFSIPLN